MKQLLLFLSLLFITQLYAVENAVEIEHIEIIDANESLNLNTFVISRAE